MTDSPRLPSSILVDVELPEPEPLSSELIAALSPLRVVLVGWYAVPEQTSPEHARGQFKEEAQSTLDAVARRFEEAGAESVTSRLVFTGNKFDTLTRISTEEDCDAVLIPEPMEHLRRLLVPLRGSHNTAHIVPFVADLVRDSDTTDVTLFHVLQGGETEAHVQKTLLGPVVKQLADRGVDTELVERRTVRADDPADAIVEATSHYDLVVLGETRPSIRDILFGTVPEKIAKKARVPLIVVRHEQEEVEMAERALRT